MNILEGLNKPQQEAVKATEGRIRVVAGAGSGKTRVLAHRFAYLVNELGLDPGNILCTTFTNKAAREMGMRISKLVSVGNVNDFVCTIHGFCVKFLRKEIYRIGWPLSFTILDEEDTKILAKDVMTELGMTTTVVTIQQFLLGIGQNKSRSRNGYIGDFFAKTEGINLSQRDGEFGLYLHKQLKGFCLDFQDLIYATLYILCNFPDACRYWQEKLNYVMVDEAQDLNGSEWDLIEMLSAMYKNLFIVGDPDQAIYEWRGSSPYKFISFTNDQTIILNQNYRSTPDILNVANSVICKNIGRVEKDLYTHNSSGAMVVHFHGKNELEESDWIAKQITKAVNEAGALYSDFSVLFRSSYLSRSVEQALIRANIPYVVWGGIKFFERKEIKDVLAYLRLVAVGDDLSFQRILNVPSRKLGKAFLKQVKEVADLEQCSLFEALKSRLSSELNRPTAVEFVELIEEARTKVDTMKLSDFVNYVVENSGLKSVIREDGDTDRLENLEELLNSVKLYEEEHAEDDVTLTSYLQDIALYTNTELKPLTKVVKLMTIHQAKGLEFPYVFVIGLTEGIMPNQRSIRDRKRAGLEEERRLMYVAATRAEKGLFLTESEGFLAQYRTNKYPSRFLHEIKRDLFVTEGKIDDELWQATNRIVENENISNGIMIESNVNIEVGTVFQHPAFGRGEIVSVNKESLTCTVKFGETQRMLQYNFVLKLLQS